MKMRKKQKKQDRNEQNEDVNFLKHESKHFAMYFSFDGFFPRFSSCTRRPSFCVRIPTFFVGVCRKFVLAAKCRYLFYSRSIRWRKNEKPAKRLHNVCARAKVKCMTVYRCSQSLARCTAEEVCGTDKALNYIF